MLRRPPTSLELKMDDISEYEEIKQKEKQSSTSTELPKWAMGHKSKAELHARIGYANSPTPHPSKQKH